MSCLESEFAQTWQNLKLSEPITLLLSGGGDSVALFHLLKSASLDFKALHFVHDGDPKFSKLSRDFCAKLCEDHGVRLEVEKVAGKILMAQGDLSWEAACRSLRYESLKHREGSFLTAHTADDQAETLALRLLEGSGLAGLGGIKPLREDGVARPLLGFSRALLRAYLIGKGMEWVDDPTNLDGNDRARLRHKVMPLLTEVQPNLLENLSRTSGFLRQDEDFLQRELEDWLHDHSNQQGDSWQLADLRALHGSLLVRFFKRLWLAFSPAGFRPRGTLFKELQKLVKSGRNDSWVNFPGGWAVGVLGERLWARPVLSEQAWSLEPLDLESDGEKWQVGEGRLVRVRRTGDKFRGKCLKKLLATTGHPPWVRDRWPLLVEGEKVLAVYDLGSEPQAREQATHTVRFDALFLRGSIG